MCSLIHCDYFSHPFILFVNNNPHYHPQLWAFSSSSFVFCRKTLRWLPQRHHGQVQLLTWWTLAAAATICWLASRPSSRCHSRPVSSWTRPRWICRLTLCCQPARRFASISKRCVYGECVLLLCVCTCYCAFVTIECEFWMRTEDTEERPSSSSILSAFVILQGSHILFLSTPSNKNVSFCRLLKTN